MVRDVVVAMLAAVAAGCCSQPDDSGISSGTCAVELVETVPEADWCGGVESWAPLAPAPEVDCDGRPVGGKLVRVAPDDGRIWSPSTSSWEYLAAGERGYVWRRAERCPDY